MEEMKAHPWVKLTGVKVEETQISEPGVSINQSPSSNAINSAKIQEMQASQKSDNQNSKGIFSPIVKNPLFPPGTENILGTPKKEANLNASTQSTSSNQSEQPIQSNLHKNAEDKPDFQKIKPIVSQTSVEWTDEELSSYANRKESVWLQNFFII